MMKKSAFLVLALTLGLTSCGLGGGKATTATPTTGTATGSALGGLLSGLLGNSQTLTAAKLAGTWAYRGTDCVFESENLLMQAGGAVAAKKIEQEANSMLGKVGIKAGSCSLTFNTDGTWTSQLGGRTLGGQYTLGQDGKTLQLTYLGGLMTLSARTSLKGGRLSLLFESDKLLKLASSLSTLSGSTALKAAGQLAQAYDGMLLGLQLDKQ